MKLNRLNKNNSGVDKELKRKFDNKKTADDMRVQSNKENMDLANKLENITDKNESKQLIETKMVKRQQNGNIKDNLKIEDKTITQQTEQQSRVLQIVDDNGLLMEENNNQNLQQMNDEVFGQIQQTVNLQSQLTSCTSMNTFQKHCLNCELVKYETIRQNLKIKEQYDQKLTSQKQNLQNYYQAQYNQLWTKITQKDHTIYLLQNQNHQLRNQIQNINNQAHFDIDHFNKLKLQDQSQYVKLLQVKQNQFNKELKVRQTHYFAIIQKLKLQIKNKLVQSQQIKQSLQSQLQNQFFIKSQLIKVQHQVLVVKIKQHFQEKQKTSQERYKIIIEGIQNEKSEYETLIRKEIEELRELVHSKNELIDQYQKFIQNGSATRYRTNNNVNFQNQELQQQNLTLRLIGQIKNQVGAKISQQVQAIKTLYEIKVTHLMQKIKQMQQKNIHLNQRLLQRKSNYSNFSRNQHSLNQDIIQKDHLQLSETLLQNNLLQQKQILTKKIYLLECQNKTKQKQLAIYQQTIKQLQSKITFLQEQQGTTIQVYKNQSQFYKYKLKTLSEEYFNFKQQNLQSNIKQNTSIFPKDQSVINDLNSQTQSPQMEQIYEKYQSLNSSHQILSERYEDLKNNFQNVRNSYEQLSALWQIQKQKVRSQCEQKEIKNMKEMQEKLHKQYSQMLQQMNLSNDKITNAYRQEISQLSEIMRQLINTNYEVNKKQKDRKDELKEICYQFSEFARLILEQGLM